MEYNNGLIEIVIQDDKKDYLLDQENFERIIFLFVNPKSGSQEGKQILQLAEKYNLSKTNNLKYVEFKDNDNFVVYVFSIINQEESDAGYDLLQKYIRYAPMRVLVGGGDGTVLSTIENFSHKGLDLDRCIFGHLPLGTGNDLSNALGFGSK